MAVSALTGDSSTDPAIATLKEAVEARLPSRLQLAARLLAEHAKDSLQEITVESVLNGMRGLPCVLWEVSDVGVDGVKYHGKTLDEIDMTLPKWPGSSQFSPEAVMWFLYTAAAPSQSLLQEFSAALLKRSELPEDVKRLCDSLPRDIPPMSQMVMCATRLADHSRFSAALARGVPKRDMWVHAFEDSLDVAARVPMLVARIHANVARNGEGRDMPLDYSQDIAQNFAALMGKSDPEFVELIRAYWSLHMDHGANVSSHVMRICSSAWTDAYSTIAAGLIGGTGTLHAGAIVRAVQFNLGLSSSLGPNPTDEAIATHVQTIVKKGINLPGYGHAVLRGVDPRLRFVRKFLDNAHLDTKDKSRTALLNLVSQTDRIVPDLLRKLVPHLKNPAPNVDALSGCLLYSYGIDLDFLLPVIVCSRGMGFMAQYTWDRALSLPIERPLSVTMEQMLSLVERPQAEP